jgi:hypothetical protein
MRLPNNVSHRSPLYLGSLPFTDVAHIKAFKESLKELHGVTSIRVRGRHSDRKSVLKSAWRRRDQNDIPWVKAEWVAFYKR